MSLFDNDDDYGPVPGNRRAAAGGGPSKLASLFSKDSQMKSAGNTTLQFKAKKESGPAPSPALAPGGPAVQASPALGPSASPSPALAASPAPVQAPSSEPPSLVFACLSETLVKYDVSQQATQFGPRGVAIVRNSMNGFTLVCYEPQTRKQDVAVPVTVHLALTLSPGFFVGFFDPSRQYWVIKFRSSAEVDQLAMHVAMVKDYDLQVTGQPRVLQTQDLDSPALAAASEQALAAGDSVKVRYALYLPSATHPKDLGPLALAVGDDGKPSTFKILEKKKELTGIQQGVIGMRSSGRRFLVIPPGLGLGFSAALPVNHSPAAGGTTRLPIPATVPLLVEVSIVKLKFANPINPPSAQSAAGADNEEEAEAGGGGAESGPPSLLLSDAPATLFPSSAGPAPAPAPSHGAPAAGAASQQSTPSAPASLVSPRASEESPLSATPHADKAPSMALPSASDHSRMSLKERMAHVSGKPRLPFPDADAQAHPHGHAPAVEHALSPRGAAHPPHDQSESARAVQPPAQAAPSQTPAGPPEAQSQAPPAQPQPQPSSSTQLTPYTPQDLTPGQPPAQSQTVPTAHPQAMPLGGALPMQGMMPFMPYGFPPFGVYPPSQQPTPAPFGGPVQAAAGPVPGSDSRAVSMLTDLAARVEAIHSKLNAEAGAPDDSETGGGGSLSAYGIVQQINAMTRQRDRLKKQLDAKTERVEALQAKITELHEKNERYMEENARLLEQRMERSAEDTQHRHAQLLELQEEKRRLQSELTDQKMRASELEYQLSAARQQTADHSALQATVQTLQTRISTLTAELAAAQATAVEKTTALDSEVSVRESIARQVTALEASLRSSEQQRAALAADLQARSAGEEVASLRQQLGALEEQLRESATQHRTAASQVTELQTANGELKLNLERSKQHADQLAAEVEAVRESVKTEYERGRTEGQHAADTASDELRQLRARVAGIEKQEAEGRAAIERLEAARLLAEEQLVATRARAEELEQQQADVVVQSKERMAQLRARLVEQEEAAVERIKSVMSSVYFAIERKFAESRDYSAADVKSAARAVIKDITLRVVEGRDLEPEEESAETGPGDQSDSPGAAAEAKDSGNAEIESELGSFDSLPELAPRVAEPSAEDDQPGDGAEAQAGPEESGGGGAAEEENAGL